MMAEDPAGDFVVAGMPLSDFMACLESPALPDDGGEDQQHQVNQGCLDLPVDINLEEIFEDEGFWSYYTHVDPSQCQMEVMMEFNEGEETFDHSEAASYGLLVNDLAENGRTDNFDSQHGSPAPGSVMSEGDAPRHRSEEEAKEVQPPAKRMKVWMGGKTSAAAAGEGDGSSAGASPASAAPSGTSTPSIRPRIPPFPTTGKKKDLLKWQKECRIISEILKADPRRKLPTQREPKDLVTTDAVLSSRDKLVVRGVARSIVNISSVMHDGSRGSQCTGIIMGHRESNGKQRTLIVTCSQIICRGVTLLDPVPKLSVGLPNKTILDGQFLFFNDHYGIALLEIDVDSPLQRPSIGSGPKYGQEVFVLARDGGLSLRARRGEVLWLEESYYIGRGYQMFLSCEVPVAGNGGSVIDHDGNVTGMAFFCNTDPTVLSISTIVTCIEMWLRFSRIARPIHDLGVRTIELLDVSLQEEINIDHGIDSGFIVDTVSHDSAAESLGILPGDVIVSFNDQHALTLPQLEDYLLSLGWIFLNDSSSTVDLNLEVYDLMKQSKRSITLPIRFCDA